MGLLFLPLLLSLQTPQAASLSAAAQASPEPALCRTRERVWTRTQEPVLALDCRLLAHGYSKLRSNSAASLVSAKAIQSPALKLDAELLEARGLLRQGDPRAAHARFVALSRRSKEMLRPTQVLRERAAAAWQSGDLQTATFLYRRLVQRIGFLPDRDRAFAIVEAALAIAELGRNSWAEAKGLLPRVARADALRGAHYLSSVAARLIERSSPSPAGSFPNVERMLKKPNRLWVSTSARLALLAAAAEGSKPAHAARLWEKYRAQPNTVFLPQEGVSAVEPREAY